MKTKNQGSQGTLMERGLSRILEAYIVSYLILEGYKSSKHKKKIERLSRRR